MFAFSPAVALASTTDDGQASQGSIVKIAGGNFNQDIITYGTDSYLGKTDYPHVGGDMYPTVSLTITGCGANETKGAVLGVTLNQTAKNDENGEKLLYNPRKAAEMGVSISGQSCPIVTKGIFSYSGSVLATDQVAGTGQALYVDANGELTMVTS